MKTLLLDMDGVLVDFVPHWLNYLNLFEGIDIKCEEVTKYTLHETHAGQRELTALAGRTVKNFKSPFKMPGFFRTAPMMPGARKFIKELQVFERTEAFEFFVLTSPSGGVSAKEKMEWLEATFGPVKTIITDHKHMVAGDILVDDCPEKIRGWLRHHPAGKGLIPWTPYLNNELLRFGMANESENHRVLYDPTVRNHDAISDGLFFKQVIDEVEDLLYT